MNSSEWNGGKIVLYKMKVKKKRKKQPRLFLSSLLTLKRKRGWRCFAYNKDITRDDLCIRLHRSSFSVQFRSNTFEVTLIHFTSNVRNEICQFWTLPRTYRHQYVKRFHTYSACCTVAALFELLPRLLEQSEVKTLIKITEIFGNFSGKLKKKKSRERKGTKKETVTCIRDTPF